MNWRFGICTVLYAFSVSCGNVRLATAVPLGDEAGGENVISLVGSGCEPVRAGETRSSIRLRATDKASFNAVEKIPELSEYRETLPSHDFNVLVYNILDNYIEDQTVRTLSQDDQKICVEMTGYLNSENILKVLNENFQKYGASAAADDTVQFAETDYPDRLEIENPANLTASAPLLPPKPQPKISAEVAAVPAESDEISEPGTKPSAPQPQRPVQTDTAPERFPSSSPAAVSSDAASAVKTRPNESATYVFIDKTLFYNNTSTLKFYQDLKSAVEERPGVRVTSDQQQAAYTLKSRVLRAKVDPVNQQTSRLQMVIAVELEQPGKNSVVEHQNRFILFDEKDDEQKVAANLMRKLLVQAAHIVAKKIKLPQSEAIITPADSNYGVFVPTLQP